MSLQKSYKKPPIYQFFKILVIEIIQHLMSNPFVRYHIWSNFLKKYR
jgi:hypothetical protein